MPIFSFLDHLPIRIWDESRNAANAYEMYVSKNYLITTYGFQPDLWNTKPPLLAWCQIFFFHILGVSELAVRLPSAISAFLTCILLFFFGRKYLDNSVLGIVSVLILITSAGYVDHHSIRTGDFDAMLTLFTTGAAIFLFLFLEYRKEKYWYIFVVALSLAVLTKGIAGLLFTPAYLLYVIYKKQLIPLLKNKHLYLGILSFVIIVASFYVSREIVSPGYWQAVYENELGGRFSEALDQHAFPADFYIKNLINLKFSNWIWVAMAGMIIGFFWKDERVKSFNILSILLIVIHLTLISKAQTKLIWYDVPDYPFLAFHCALSIVFVYNLIIEQKHLTINISPLILGTFFLVLIFINPYSDIVKKVYKPKEINEYGTHSYGASYYLQRAIKSDNARELDGAVILYNEYWSHLLFYFYQYKEQGINLVHQYHPDLKPGDVAITDRQVLKQAVEGTYHYELLDSFKDANVYRIIGIK